MRIAALLLVALLVGAGCISTEPSSTSSTSGPAPTAQPPTNAKVFKANEGGATGGGGSGGNGTNGPTATSTSSSAPIPVEEAPASFGETGFTLVGHNGAEPSMGITSDGSLFVASFSVIMRSQDEGATWQAVQEHAFMNSDPMMWVDTLTDRVYHAPMFPILLCSTLYWSDDAGTTWTTNPDVACGRGAFDHQKLASARPGPDLNPAAGLLWPTVLYLCYNGIATTNCGVSYDGGLTWPVDRPTHVNLVDGGDANPTFTGCGSGQNGHPTGAPDGTIVFARNGPGCPQPLVVLSRDSGLTWTTRIGPNVPDPTALDPEVAFTPDGTMYMLFQDASYRNVLSRSRDMGQTWDDVWDVMPPGTTVASFQALHTGSDGRIAMAFLAADRGSGNPSSLEDEARWSLYIVTSEDADGEDPTFVAYQVTPNDDPVQIGPIWQGGGGDPSRNLLDFIDGSVAPDGTFYVTYTEGCVNEACVAADGTANDSRSDETAVAWLKGWSLYNPGEGRPALLN